MAEKIDPTWLAYAFTEQPGPRQIEAGLARLKDHYGGLVSYPLQITTQATGQLGIAVLGDTDPHCSWPQFLRAGAVSAAFAYPPAGWKQVTGDHPPDAAALPLVHELLEHPPRAAERLSPPSVLGILDERDGRERLLVLNDCIGGGRLYETALAQGRVWSNRAAAGLLFAGIEPRADGPAWELLAAAGWFFGATTPFAEVRRVERGSVIEAEPGGVTSIATGAVGHMVAPQSEDLETLFEEAALTAIEQAKTAAELWERAPVIHLSGGRDSRLVAAAAMAGDVEAVLRTSDNSPGEADVARRLVAVAPRRLEHAVTQTEEGGGPETPLLERAVRGALLHDGVRHASKLRRDVGLPRSRPNRATMAGWGGEIGHAFYLHNARQLRQVRRRGLRGVLRRLDESSRKKHAAAHERCYERAAAEYEARAAEGQAFGLDDPTLLDWFYLVERFVHRFEIGADSQGLSVFATPAFIRAAFAMSPEQRLEAKAHSEITARLVPAWADIPYYRRESGAQPTLRRLRLWESERDAAAFAALIGEEGMWTTMFDPERVRSMWEEVRRGAGSYDYETVFERIVAREAFERVVESLCRAAGRGEPLFAAASVR